MPRILITPRSLTTSGHPSFTRLREAGFEVIFSTPGRQPDEAELLQLLPGCVGWLAGVEPISAKVLRAARDLRVISRNGVGVDNIDLAMVEELKIEVCRAEAGNARGVAELTIALLLAMARSIPFHDAVIKQSRWDRRKGFELEGKTLGVVGCGRIGKLVSQLAIGLGMKVLGYDLFSDRAFAPAPAFRFVSLDEIWSSCDVITLHCPPPAGGRPLIDGEVIAKMKPGIHLINTARSSLIDGPALLAAMQRGHVAGVALDVFEVEPPVVDALLASDRVITTPHIGGLTEESIDRAVSVAVENLLRVLS